VLESQKDDEDRGGGRAGKRAGGNARKGVQKRKAFNVPPPPQAFKDLFVVLAHRFSIPGEA
jgi:hypothetical protein